MPLTDDERLACRGFVATEQARLVASFLTDHPTWTISPHVGSLRHLCAARDNISTALRINEVYVLSPAYPRLGVPAGRFAYIYRDGGCRRCGTTARSHGWVAEAGQRPPLHERDVRRRQMPDDKSVKNDDTVEPVKLPAQQESIPGPVYKRPEEADATDERDDERDEDK